MDINIYNENFSHRIHAESSNLLLQKILKFTCIIIGILVSIVISLDLGFKIFNSYSTKGDAFRILSLNLNKSENNSNKTEDMDIPAIDLNELQKEIELQKDLLINFYNKVDRKTYRGKWHSNETFNFLSKRTEGEMAFRIEKLNIFNAIEFEKTYLVFRLLDGHYIDKWTLIRNFNRPFSNLTIGNKSISQNFNTYVDFGEIFEKIEYGDIVNSDENSEDSENSDNTLNPNSSNCKSSVFLDWSNNTHDNITNIVGTFSSNCGINNISFELELEKDDEEYGKVMFYSIIVTGLALTQIFNTIWLTHKLSDSQTFANSISLITVLQNIVWNAYGCLCHFFLTVNYDYYTLQFGVPAFLYFANFSIFEIKLLYSLWRIKNLRYINDQAILRKKLIQFYFFFYIVMFFSLFYVMKFFFEKPYILTAIIFTWVPQIIFNAIYRNRTSMPILNILLFGLNKIFLPFYFRGCPDNFFQLSTDYKFILICFTCLVIETLILYSQAVFGSRWLLPRRFDETTFNFYKTKDEVLFLKPDAENHDCVICLFSLLSNENYKHFSDDFIAAGAGDEVIPTKRVCNYLEIFRYNFRNFHEVSLNYNKKPFMMTPCKHIFHTPCLESWFKQKKECPSCRQDIDETAIEMAL